MPRQQFDRGKQYAHEIQSMRHLFPQAVEDLLVEIESHGGKTCDYWSIVEQLWPFVEFAREDRRSRGLWVDIDVTHDPMYRLIHYIKMAHDHGIQIARPLTAQQLVDRFRPGGSFYTP